MSSKAVQFAKIGLGSALLGMLAIAPADAATATANLGVSATVSSNCSISTSPVAFGSYDPVGTNAATPLDSAGTVTVTCTSGASTTITLGQGANAGGGSTEGSPVRRMRDSGSGYLSYALYQDASRMTAWGNTGPTGVSHTGTGSSANISVYGRVAAGQNVASGSYSDTVLATITF